MGPRRVLGGAQGHRGGLVRCASLNTQCLIQSAEALTTSHEALYLRRVMGQRLRRDGRACSSTWSTMKPHASSEKESIQAPSKAGTQAERNPHDHAASLNPHIGTCMTRPDELHCIFQDSTKNSAELPTPAIGTYLDHSATLQVVSMPSPSSMWTLGLLSTFRFTMACAGGASKTVLICGE